MLFQAASRPIFTPKARRIALRSSRIGNGVGAHLLIAPSIFLACIGSVDFRRDTRSLKPNLDGGKGSGKLAFTRFQSSCGVSKRKRKHGRAVFSRKRSEVCFLSSVSWTPS